MTTIKIPIAVHKLSYLSPALANKICTPYITTVLGIEPSELSDRVQMKERHVV